MRRSRRGAALLTGIIAAVAPGAALPALAQDDPATSPICVLSADEVTDLTGVSIAEVDAAGLECAYSADPATRPVQVLLAIVPPDPTALEPSEDGLLLPRMDRPDGTDGSVAGLPAWIAGDAVWVDVGEDVLMVWVNALFDADPPPVPDTAVALAEAAVPRYVAAPRPSPTPRAAAGGVVGRFPEEVAGQPLDLLELAAPDLFSLLGILAPGDAALGIAQLQEAIAALGVAPEDVQGATGDIYDLGGAGSLSISAIAVPGQDVASLVDPAVLAFADWDGATPETVTIAGRDVVHVTEPPGGSDGNAWFLADGDVLWILSGDRVVVEALLTALPPAGGAG